MRRHVYSGAKMAAINMEIHSITKTYPTTSSNRTKFANKHSYAKGKKLRKAQLKAARMSKAVSGGKMAMNLPQVNPEAPENFTRSTAETKIFKLNPRQKANDKSSESKNKSNMCC